MVMVMAVEITHRVCFIENDDLIRRAWIFAKGMGMGWIWHEASPR